MGNRDGDVGRLKNQGKKLSTGEAFCYTFPLPMASFQCCALTNGSPTVLPGCPCSFFWQLSLQVQTSGAWDAAPPGEEFVRFVLCASDACFQVETTTRNAFL